MEFLRSFLRRHSAGKPVPDSKTPVDFFRKIGFERRETLEWEFGAKGVGLDTPVGRDSPLTNSLSLQNGADKGLSALL